MLHQLPVAVTSYQCALIVAGDVKNVLGAALVQRLGTPVMRPAFGGGIHCRTLHETDTSTDERRRGSAMALHDSRNPEQEPTEGEDARPAPSDRGRPAPLAPTDRTFLLQALARRQHRRHAYRAGPLRMWWDGEERLQCDPRAEVCEPFRVPLRASYVEIVGDDAEGALLLAVVPLPDPEEMEDNGVEHLAVNLEGGQTVTVAIALDYGSGGKARAYVIQITYAESASATGVSVREPASTFIRAERDMVDYLDNGVVGCHWVGGDGTTGPSSGSTEPITSHSATPRRNTWGITLPSSTLTPTSATTCCGVWLRERRSTTIGLASATKAARSSTC